MKNRSYLIFLIVVSILAPLIKCALSQSSGIIQKTLENVVMIMVMNEEYQPLGIGSGFTVGSDGEIATNYHVIESASFAIVKFVNQEDKYPVTSIVHRSPENDIAVVKIDVSTTPLKLGDDKLVGIGERILAIGNPEGLEGTVSEGIISGFRQLTGNSRLIQVTAPISPGSSGGPIIDENGQVLGIASASLIVGQNLNFAIPVNQLKKIQLQQRENLPFAKTNLPKTRKPKMGSSTKENDLVKVFNVRIGTHRTGGSADITFSIRNNLRKDIKLVKAVILWKHKGEVIHYSAVVAADLIPSFYTKIVQKPALRNVGNLPRDVQAEARVMDYQILESSGLLDFR